MLWIPSLDHFEAFVSKLTLDNGQRMRLEPFQRKLLADYFEGTMETLIIIPKKNGKTTLMAALMLHHLVYVADAKGYIAASSRKQAGLLYGQAARFVERSPGLQERILVRRGTYELRSLRDSGTFEVLAADSDTADGVGPTLAIVDELHRAKSTALYDVFRDGLSARDGGMLAITTAGQDEDSPLGLMRANALALPHVERTGTPATDPDGNVKPGTGTYTYARSDGGTFVLHEFGLTPLHDAEDLDLVKEVNPLASLTRSRLRDRRVSPSMTVSAWLRFACNVWTQDELAAIAREEWEAKAIPMAALPEGSTGLEPVIGIDLGWTKDTTALIPVGYTSHDRDVVVIDHRLRIIQAGTQADGTISPKRATDVEVIHQALRELHELWPDCRFALDPAADGRHLAHWLETELCDGDEERVLTYSQNPAPMQDASMHLSQGIRADDVQEPPEFDEDGDPTDEPRLVPLYHPDDPELNAHAFAAQARWNGERWRFDKRRIPTAMASKVKAKPIDGIIGAAIGYRELTSPEDEGMEPFVLSAAA